MREYDSCVSDCDDGETAHASDHVRVVEYSEVQSNTVWSTVQYSRVQLTTVGMDGAEPALPVGCLREFCLRWTGRESTACPLTCT